MKKEMNASCVNVKYLKTMLAAIGPENVARKRGRISCWNVKEGESGVIDRALLRALRMNMTVDTWWGTLLSMKESRFI